MEFDANNTPFIRLPAPLTNIILAPPLYSDGEAVIEILNDPRVYMNLNGPPFPYEQKEWDEWFPLIQKSSSEALIEFQEVEKLRKGVGEGPKEGRRWVSAGSPISAIREVDPVTGEQRFIGTISFGRADRSTSDGEDKGMLNDVHISLEAKGSEMGWVMGCESPLFILSRLIFHPPICLKSFRVLQSIAIPSYYPARLF
jgi:RimJ/RimL family protein N-acetyltransferase